MPTLVPRRRRTVTARRSTVRSLILVSLTGGLVMPFVTAAAGCRSTERVLENQAGREPEIEFLDADLDRTLQVLPSVTVDRPPIPMRVQVPVQNTQRFQDLTVDYRFVFYDRDDLEMEPPMPWKPVTLLATESRRFSGRAYSEGAVRWTLKVRRAGGR